MNPPAQHLPSLSSAGGGPLAPGSVIGILGGGQLGRMIALAAAELGYRCHVFTPEEDAPAVHVTDRSTVAGWQDETALATFAAACDVVTYEFENIPARTAKLVARQVPLRPNPEVLATCQNRIAEKGFLAGIGVPTTRWLGINSEAALAAAVTGIGRPAVLKSARLGYDGKGQVAIRDGTDLAQAWAETTAAGQSVAILEAWVDFAMEISVVVARSADGAVAAYVPVENQHADHVLKRTVAPAAIDAATARQARDIAERVAAAIGIEGVLAVEMFVCSDGGLLVNELAPRPHNSGHWTLDACAVSQFEQCVRAVVGLPLGPTDRHSDAVMDNILGAEIDRWQELAADPAARLHLYGKREARPGRKMGHVTWLLR